MVIEELLLLKNNTSMFSCENAPLLWTSYPCHRQRFLVQKQIERVYELA